MGSSHWHKWPVWSDFHPSMPFACLSNSQVHSNSQAAEGHNCCDGTNRHFKRECIFFIPPKGLCLHKGRYWTGSLLCCLCIHTMTWKEGEIYPCHKLFFPVLCFHFSFPSQEPPPCIVAFWSPKAANWRGEGNSKMWDEVAGATVRCWTYPAVCICWVKWGRRKCQASSF